MLDYKSKVATMMSLQFNQNEVLNGSEGEFKTLPKLKKNKWPVALDTSNLSVDTSTDKMEPKPKKSTLKEVLASEKESETCSDK